MRLRARSIGPIARRTLRDAAAGSVIAVFGSSFYARFRSQPICIGETSLPRGPLNIVLADSGSARFSDWLAHGDPVRLMSSSNFAHTQEVTIDISNAQNWSPPVPSPIAQRFVGSGLAALRRLSPDPPAEGLGQLLGSCRIETPLTRIARDAATHLQEVIARGGVPDPQFIARIIGLGPGLTPSGDDYLGALLIALHQLDRGDLAEPIWQGVAANIDSLKTEISAAHLRAAAEGFGSEPLHDLLDDVVAGGSASLANKLAALTRIGHTSGWDTLAGAIAALEAMVDADAYCAAST